VTRPIPGVGIGQYGAPGGLMLAADELTPVPMSAVIASELELIGSHGMPAGAYPAMVTEIASGALGPHRWITRRIRLDAAPASLAELDQQPSDGITMIIP